jgi:hypothetical protein
MFLVAAASHWQAIVAGCHTRRAAPVGWVTCAVACHQLSAMQCSHYTVVLPCPQYVHVSSRQAVSLGACMLLQGKLGSLRSACLSSKRSSWVLMLHELWLPYNPSWRVAGGRQAPTLSLSVIVVVASVDPLMTCRTDPVSCAYSASVAASP